MTTIIREGRYLYTDSRYTSYYGGYRISEDGPCKVTRNEAGTALIAMAGKYEPSIPFELLTEIIDEAILLLSSESPNTRLVVANKLRDYYNDINISENDDRREHHYNILVCAEKGTFLFNAEAGDFWEMYYPAGQHVAIGSGAISYVPFRIMDISIEEKFKNIYSSDPASGGIVNRIDIHQLNKVNIS